MGRKTGSQKRERRAVTATRPLASAVFPALAWSSCAAYLALRLPVLNRLYCHIDDCGLTRDLLLLRGSVTEIVKTAFTLWTTAPGKYFFLTPILRAFTVSPDSALWISRGSSVLLGFAGFVALLAFLRRRDGGRFSRATVITLFLAAFSVKEMANAQQAFHYSVSALVALAFVWALERAASEKRLSTASGAVLGAGAGIACWFQYQAMILFPAWALAVLVARGKGAIRALIAASAGFLCFFLPLKSFSFDAIKYHSMTDWLLDYALPSWNPLTAISFYAKNTWLVLRSSVMVSPDYATPIDWVSAIAVAIALWGVVVLFRSRKDAFARAFLAFVALCFGAFMAGAAVGKMPYSPTRHTLILAPLVLILFWSGLTRLFEAQALRQPARANGVLGLALALIMSFGLQGTIRYTRDRLDLIRAGLPPIVSSVNPEMIVTYNWTELPQLLYSTYTPGQPPALTRRIAALEPRFETNAFYLFSPPPKSVLFVSHRGPLPGWITGKMASMGYGAPKTVSEASTPASDEPLGERNGKNGFYAYLFLR